MDDEDRLAVNRGGGNESRAAVEVGVCLQEGLIGIENKWILRGRNGDAGVRR